jgi:hypothetical protein
LLLVVLLDSYKERDIPDTKEGREKVDLVIYSLLELLLVIGHLLGNRSKV